MAAPAKAEVEKSVETKNPNRQDRIARVTTEIQQILFDLYDELATEYGKDNALTMSEVETMCTNWK